MGPVQNQSQSSQAQGAQEAYAPENAPGAAAKRLDQFCTLATLSGGIGGATRSSGRIYYYRALAWLFFLDDQLLTCSARPSIR